MNYKALTDWTRNKALAPVFAGILSHASFYPEDLSTIHNLLLDLQSLPSVGMRPDNSEMGALLSRAGPALRHPEASTPAGTSWTPGVGGEGEVGVLPGALPQTPLYERRTTENTLVYTEK